MGIPKDLFVDPDIPSEFLCAICHDVVEEPKVHNSCDRAFCKSCIDQWLIRSNTCPVDRKLIDTADEMKPTRLFTNLLNHLKLRCPFQANGCEPVLRLEFFADHRQKCEFNPEKPKNCDGGCGAQLKLNERPGHNCVEYLKEALEATRRELAAKELELQRAQNAPRQFGEQGAGSSQPLVAGARANPPITAEMVSVTVLESNFPETHLSIFKECVVEAYVILGRISGNRAANDLEGEVRSALSRQRQVGRIALVNVKVDEMLASYSHRHPRFRISLARERDKLKVIFKAECP